MTPSLNIMQAELATSYYNDIGFFIQDTTLHNWVDQGVLLLNSSLTCTAYQPEGWEMLYEEGSHSWYWRFLLMEELFHWMSINFENIVFVFMGKKAQYYNKFIDPIKHTILNVIHPVADARSGKSTFVGSQIFNRINDKLSEYGKTIVEW